MAAKKKSRKAAKKAPARAGAKSSGRSGGQSSARSGGRGSGRSGSTGRASSGSSSGGRRSRGSGKESPSLQELLVLELQEIHSAESQLARIIPRLVKAADAEDLDAALEERLQEGEQIIGDVEQALEELGASPGRKKNVAAEGLVNDMREHVQEIEAGPALDTVLIAALQKTEHYCIAAWGTVKSLAQVAGQEDLVNAMERALEEGKSYDERLTQFAEAEITPKLLAQDSGSGEEGEEDGEEDEDDDAEDDEDEEGGAEEGGDDEEEEEDEDE